MNSASFFVNGEVVRNLHIGKWTRLTLEDRTVTGRVVGIRETFTDEYLINMADVEIVTREQGASSRA